MIHDVGAVGNAQSFPHIMVGNERPNSRPAQFPDQVLQVLDGQGIDPRERFIQQDKARLQRQ